METETAIYKNIEDALPHLLILDQCHEKKAKTTQS